MKCLRPSRKDDNHLTAPGRAGKRGPGLFSPASKGLGRLTGQGPGRKMEPAFALRNLLAVISGAVFAVCSKIFSKVFSTAIFAVCFAVMFGGVAGFSAPHAFAGEVERGMLERLEKGGVAERRQAIAGLARQGGPGAVPPLVGALRDLDPVSRALAEQALWSIWMRSGDARVDKVLQKGTGLMAEGELEKALEVFDQVIKLRPGFAEGYNKRATVLFHLGRFQQSLDDIAQTLRRNPYHFGALSGAGLCMLGLKRPRDALAFFKRALGINPNMEGIINLKNRVEGRLQKPVA